MENASSMSTGWYAATRTAGAEGMTGPLTWSELHGLAWSQALRPSDLVWHPPMPDWAPAEQIPGLLGPQTGLAAPAIAQPSAPAKRHSRLLPILIPLIALAVGAGSLGAYFAFWHGDGARTEVGASSTTTTQLSGSSTATAPLTSTKFALPGQTALVQTAKWGWFPWTSCA